MRVLGIDEAGRGCVLGALVIGGFVTEDVEEQLLRDAGAADSKRLSVKRRSLARAALSELGQADVRLVSAIEIDQGNLNTLEETVIADLVRTWRPDLVRMDALGPPRGIPKVIARIQAMVGDDIRPTWVVEPKADHTYAETGAASIFAKTTRDALLDELKKEWGVLGSGYPSDPKTRTWLTDWIRSGKPWPPFVRTRWQTIANLTQLAH